MKYSVFQVFGSGKRLKLAKFLTVEDAKLFVQALEEIESTPPLYEIEYCDLWSTRPIVPTW